MSRGLGKVERAVLEVLKEKGAHAPNLKLLTGAVAEKLGMIVSRGGKTGFTESLYRSVARAVRMLEQKDELYTLGKASDMITNQGAAKILGHAITPPRETMVFLNVPEEDEGNT